MLKWTRQKIPIIGRNMEQLEFSYTASQNVKWWAQATLPVPYPLSWMPSTSQQFHSSVYAQSKCFQMFMKNTNQNAQSNHVRNSIQMETTQMPTTTIAQSSAKLFCERPGHQYADSAGWEAKIRTTSLFSVAPQQQCKAMECCANKLSVANASMPL